MSIYEERLETDLTTIRSEVQNVGSLVETAVGNSVKSILTWNQQLAYETILKDQVINRAVKRIDHLCHAFVVRHSPTAGHLRFVSSVLRVNVALERVGDYAVTVCREMARLAEKPNQRVIGDLEISVDPAKQALSQALEAFQNSNSELARGTKEMASHLGKTFDKAFSDLVDEGEKGAAPIRDLFALLVIFNRLSRVCDQAKNICEETVFASVGETKPAKRFRILFVDDKESCLSLMAVALALKDFPECAEYSSAGCDPSEELPADFVAFMEARGHDLQVKPARLEIIPEILGEYHIIVTLSKNLAQKMGRSPYHTVVLDWGIDSVCSEKSPAFDSCYTELSAKISDLMEILTGQGPT
jgi:phosphate transport system protein